MGINNLYKLNIKDNHKSKILEEILDTEVADIMKNSMSSKSVNQFKSSSFQVNQEKEYNSFYDNDYYYQNTNLRRDTFKEEDNNPNVILPFNQEEIRPVVRDQNVNRNRYKANSLPNEGRNNTYNNPNRSNEFSVDYAAILEQLKPYIEEMVRSAVQNAQSIPRGVGLASNNKREEAPRQSININHSTSNYNNRLDIRNPRKRETEDHSSSSSRLLSSNINRQSYDYQDDHYENYVPKQNQSIAPRESYRNSNSNIRDNVNNALQNKLDYYKQRSYNNAEDSVSYNDRYNRVENDGKFYDDDYSFFRSNPKQGRFLEDNYDNRRQNIRDNKYRYDK